MKKILNGQTIKVKNIQEKELLCKVIDANYNEDMKMLEVEVIEGTFKGTRTIILESHIVVDFKDIQEKVFMSAMSIVGIAEDLECEFVDVSFSGTNVEEDEQGIICIENEIYNVYVNVYMNNYECYTVHKMNSGNYGIYEEEEKNHKEFKRMSSVKNYIEKYNR